MQRKIIHFIGFILILTVSIGFIKNPFTSSYVDQMKHADITVMKHQDSLHKEIVEKAKNYHIPAQNAEVHKVWKATPGYNGLEVDVEESYKKMKVKGEFNEKLLVFRQISPEVHLEDLPAEPMYRGHPDKPMVSFLINVAWGNEYIPDMLETLNKYHVKATFFLEGRWTKENPEMAKMIVDAGHEVGNHSYTHPDMSKLSTADIKEQLSKTSEVIKSVTDVTPTWFAPPSGSLRDEVVKIADQMSMNTVMWTVDTIDWQRPEPHVLVERVTSKVHNGALILMHPTSPTSESLETLILSIRKKGYSFGSISMMADEERLATNEKKSDE
ncbi:putative sporulation protein (polysaccharide deacetylase family) [Metabacillus crassostreae]|uniref:polysaccharide deacetylase family protein n=1 Tax=Metabacillus crassostreae TaxID=929098 RepID=UPI00195BD421|nr:polysaccharide deacetylase family protein [Metabacillus crassostreae]MBM7603274.1 putative sporulation protein (polysaccharide deacetylase family) [Metabacillus crassostreae]